MDPRTLLTPPPRSKNFPGTRYNWNVVLVWLCSIFQGCGDSIWNGMVLASFIFEMFKDSNEGNTYVGYVEAAQGLVILLVALPVGWLADKFSKSAVIVGGALCVPVAGGATIFAAFHAVAHEEHAMQSYWILFGAMCVWGLAYAVYGGPCQALLADSTPTGQRSWYYTKLAQVGLVSSAAGPIVAIAMFLTHGDKWHMADLRNVLVVGVAISLLITPIMLLYRDDCALEEETSDTHGQGGEASADGDGSDAAASGQPPGSAGEEEEGHEAKGRRPPSRSANPRLWQVPYVIFFSGLSFALGSGMTVKFFPLFFKNDLRLSPVAVQVIYLLVPLMMAFFSGLAEKASKCFGRVLVLVSFKVVGIALLVSMALLRDWIAPPQSLDTNTTSAVMSGSAGRSLGFSPAHAAAALPLAPWMAETLVTALVTDAAGSGSDLEHDAGAGYEGDSGDGDSSHAQLVRILKAVLMIFIYLMRTTLMNCTYPIEEAILMDYVPKQTRARWKSLDSISVFGWCGSAAVGGLVADAYDYSTTFLITAGLQALGTLMFAYLFFIIPHSQDVEGENAPAHSGAAEVQPAVEPLQAGSIQQQPSIP